MFACNRKYSLYFPVILFNSQPTFTDEIPAFLRPEIFHRHATEVPRRIGPLIHKIRFIMCKWVFNSRGFFRDSTDILANE